VLIAGEKLVGGSQQLPAGRKMDKSFAPQRPGAVGAIFKRVSPFRFAGNMKKKWINPSLPSDPVR